MEFNPFEEDLRTIPSQVVQSRLADLSLWVQDSCLLEAVALLLEDLPDQVSLDDLDDRLETLPDLCPHMDRARWGLVFEIILPELYAEPKVSKKTSDAVPGSRSMQWRLSERARCGLALHHPRDSAGVQKAVQATFA